MAGKERTRLALLAHTEEHQVKGGVTRSIGSGKVTNELLLVVVGQLLEVVKVLWVDRVDLVLGDGDVLEERDVVGVVV